jgi:hypothetical protein
MSFYNPILFEAVLVQLVNCIKSYTVACRRVLGNAPLSLIGSRPVVAFKNETYELNFKDYD